MSQRFHASPGAARAIGLAGVLFALSFAPALAQTLFVVNGSGTTVGAYDANTGAVINASFISSPISPMSVAVSGNDLFVGYWGDSGGNGNGRGVARYNATTGALIDSSFIPGVAPTGMTVLNNTLYVADYLWDTVGSYNATTGAVINASLFSGINNHLWGALAAVPDASIYGTDVVFFSSIGIPGTTGYAGGVFGHPSPSYPDEPYLEITMMSDRNGETHHGIYGLAHSGNLMWAVHEDGKIVAYDDHYGLPVAGPAVITGSQVPFAATAYGNTLFVSNLGGTVATYNATTGELINASFITGLDGPFSMAVMPASAVPEPATYAALLGLAAIGAVVLRRRAALKASAADAASR